MTNWFQGAAAVLVGLFAGWISVRTSRKLPHERLKQLADIRQELGALDEGRVIENAIRRELRLLKQLNDAREVSRFRYAYEWISQHPGGSFAGGIGMAYAALGLGFWWASKTPYPGQVERLLVGIPVLTATFVGTTVAGVAAYGQRRRRSRTDRSDDTPIPFSGEPD